MLLAIVCEGHVGCTAAAPSCPAHQSCPTTNRAQNMVPCANQYSGQAHLRSHSRQQCSECHDPCCVTVTHPCNWCVTRNIRQPSAPALLALLLAACAHRPHQHDSPSVQGVGTNCQGSHDADVQSQVGHGAPGVLLPAVVGDGGADVSQAEWRGRRQVIGAILWGTRGSSQGNAQGGVGGYCVWLVRAALPGASPPGGVQARHDRL